MEKSSINKTILIGRLGGDPEGRYTPSGRSYTSFSIATDEYWTDSDKNKKEHKGARLDGDDPICIATRRIADDEPLTEENCAPYNF